MTGSELGARERGTNRGGPVERHWALEYVGGLRVGLRCWRALPGEIRRASRHEVHHLRAMKDSVRRVVVTLSKIKLNGGPNMNIQGTNIDTSHPLLNPFHKWLDLMEDPTWLGNDCPWWYNERASLSQFAGAIWLTGGWVLEEFSATKQTDDNIAFKGRVDLMFWTTRRREGEQFIAEAKPCWPRLRSSDAPESIKYALNRAADDVQKTHSYNGLYEKLALVFAAPVIPNHFSSQIPDRVNSLIKSLAKEPNLSMAWHFRTMGDIPSHKDCLYPGVLLCVRPV